MLRSITRSMDRSFVGRLPPKTSALRDAIST